MPRTASGETVVKILTKEFGFYFVSPKGSHAKLKKRTVSGTITTIVPMHHELSTGTLRGALEMAKVEYTEFEKYLYTRASTAPP